MYCVYILVTVFLRFPSPALNGPPFGIRGQNQKISKLRLMSSLRHRDKFELLLWPRVQLGSGGPKFFAVRRGAQTLPRRHGRLALRIGRSAKKASHVSKPNLRICASRNCRVGGLQS